MASPDAWATANIILNLVRQPGAFNAWDNASPMTSGYTFGYWRAVACSAPTKVHLYESQECIWTVWETSGGDVYDAAAGALVDPETATTGAAESDGRLYGIMVSGQSAVRSQTTWVTGTPAAGNLFLHHTTAQSAHAGVLQPGTASIWTIQKTAAVTWDSNRLRNAASEYARLQIHMMRAGAAPNYFVGRLREMCFFVDGVIPTRHMSGVTTIGYILGSSSVTVSDSIFLKH
jgi:hypothetical protein